MAPPPPPPAKKCFVADGPYRTPEGLTFEQQLQDIDAHAKYIHRELTIPAPSAPSSAPKPTALPRPDVQEDITEEDRQKLRAYICRLYSSSASSQ